MSDNSLNRPITQLVGAGARGDSPLFVAQLDNILVRLRPNYDLLSFGTLGDVTVSEITAISLGTSDGRGSTSWVVFGERSEERYNLCVWVENTVFKIQLDSKPTAICHEPTGYIFVAEKGKISIFYYDCVTFKLKRVNEKSLGLRINRLWLTTIQGNKMLYLGTDGNLNYCMHASGLNSSGKELALDDPTPMRTFQHLFCCDNETNFLDYYEGKLRVFQRHWAEDRIYYLGSSVRSLTYWKEGLILLLNNGRVAVVNSRRTLGYQEKWRWFTDSMYGGATSYGNVLALRRGTSVVFKSPGLAPQ